MSKKKTDIYDAIQYVRTPEFKQEMMRAYWETKGLTKSWSNFMGLDNLVIIKVYENKKFLTPHEMDEVMKNFCDFGDSKRRCAELFTAWKRGDYVAKHGNIGYSVLSAKSDDPSMRNPPFNGSLTC